MANVWDVVVRHVKQPSAHTCGQACLSMVTWIDVEDLVRRLGDQGITDDIEAIILTENGILPCPVDKTFGMRFMGVYFLTVPSLNLAGSAHRIVAVSDEEGWKVYDPNEGRDGKAFYPRDALSPQAGDRALKWWGDVTYLRPMIGHLGNIDRLARYADMSPTSPRQGIA